jgi:hypothetical protein
MTKKLEKNIDLDKQTEVYDVWELSNSSNLLGSYFVPKGTTGEDYENAIISAKNKLIALGFNTLEVKALIGRQLF